MTIVHPFLVEIPDPKPLAESDTLRDLGMKQCRCCLHLVPDDCVICPKCDAFLELRVVRSAANDRP